MITLKAHYKLSALTQTAAVSLVALSYVRKDGKEVFTPTGQKKIKQIAVGVGCVSTVIHWSAHARLIGRGVKAISKVVCK